MKKNHRLLMAFKRSTFPLTIWTIVFIAIQQNAAAQEHLPKAVSLFDGKTLSGWKPLSPADQPLWKVAAGVITGGDGRDKVKANSYLCTEKEFGNFELRFLFRLSGDPATGLINSGVQYRSAIIDNHIVGYQADIGNGYWGDIYDEHRRGQLVAGDLSILKKLLREDGWNSYIVRVAGNHHELYINGIKTCDYIEKDMTIPAKGIIGIQLHAGGAGKIEISDISITEF